jgi:ferredoxin-thioredoxin reductase catalytic chain
MSYQPTDAEARALYEKLKREAEAGGYYLNPDVEFVMDLMRGMLVNIARYGYPSCPCRLASGVKEDDLDIICPCDYRDPDLSDYGACYCALYVSQAIAAGQKPAQAIPERRPPAEQRHKAAQAAGKGGATPASLPYPVWRCRVCGYLCAREGPPEICPICKAKKDRFERFM